MINDTLFPDVLPPAVALTKNQVDKMALDIAMNYQTGSRVTKDFADKTAVEVFFAKYGSRIKYNSRKDILSHSLWYAEKIVSLKDILNHANENSVIRTNKIKSVLLSMGITETEIKDKKVDIIRLKILVFASMEKQLLYENEKKSSRARQIR